MKNECKHGVYTELTGEHDLLNTETNWKQQIAEKT